MKMQVNWKAVINIILFAMLVVAFVFAIWSYIKTNAIKNSNSPSVPTVINDNNTYVNNIASAPNLVTVAVKNENQIYKVKSTDNGSTVSLIPYAADYEMDFDFSDVVNIPGFYIKVENNMDPSHTTPYNIFVRSFRVPTVPPTSVLYLPSGESASIGFQISDLVYGTSNESIYVYGQTNIFQ